MGCGGSSEKAAGQGAQKGNGAPGQNKLADKKEHNTTNKEFEARMLFLAQVPLMKRLPKDQQPIVAQNCDTVDFVKGQTIITQGEEGNAFFVIKVGEASVHIKDDKGNSTKIAVLKPGDYFGETALLRNEVRTATIVAIEQLQAFKITREKFQELQLHEKLQFANRRAAVGGGANAEKTAKEPDHKTPEERSLIAEAVKANEYLQSIQALDDSRMQSFIDVMWKEEFKQGHEIITEGDLNAHFFYVVQEGAFEIMVSEAQDHGSSQVVSVVEKGGSFGELALLYFVPRAATVKAKVDSKVWVVDRPNFKRILMKVSDKKLKEYASFLGRVELLNPLLDEERNELSRALVEMHFTKDECVIQQGEPGNTFYILYEGEVQVVNDGNVVKTLEASSSQNRAHFFGEGALLENDVRSATVKVTSATAKTLVLDREDFNFLLGPLKDIISQSKEGTTNNGRGRPSMLGKAASLQGQGQQNDKPRDKILRKDLTRIGLLGCGGFGTVELYEHSTTKETYAMKGLSKGYVIKTGMQDSVMNEKNILMMTNSDFVIKLWETYNGTQSLYFLLEPALGGELYATYNRKGFHGSHKHAKYYVAGTCFAFEHLHERRIIYRDLKPENLLLTEKGHIKLTDMGLAKFVIGKTFTTCGTPDYFAPELIASIGHTNAVDWWCLGVLIFELMSGHPPFESAYPMQIYAKVTKGISKVPFPPECHGPVGNLIKELLKSEPSERLPVRPGGVQNMKTCKWYEDFDWEKMKALELQPPYKPVVKSKKDLANFSARKEDMPRQIDYYDPNTGWDNGFASA